MKTICIIKKKGYKTMKSKTLEKIENVLMDNGTHLTIMQYKSSTEFFITDNEGNEVDVTNVLNELSKQLV